MNPADLKYNSSHEWVGMDSEGLAVIGITDFAIEQLTTRSLSGLLSP